MHRRTLSTLILVALLLSALLGGAARPVQAASYTVTKFTDSNGACDVADCSLREAIRAANAAAGPDTITLPAGTYMLTLGGYDDNAAGGDLDILDEVALIGAGSGLTIIDAAGSPDGALTVHSGASALLVGLTIRNAHGGTLYAVGCRNGTLELEDVIVRDSSTDNFGGAINAENCTLSLESSQIINNASKQGGGLYLQDSGTLISRSLISGNQAEQGGGGIFSYGSTVQLALSSVVGNDAGEGSSGGGIFQTGPIAMLVIDDSLIAGNRGAAEGGGIVATSGRSLTIRNSTISGNTTDGWGGGISTRVPTEIAASTVAYNLADTDGDGGFGGGLLAYKTEGTDTVTVSVRQSILGRNLLGNPAVPSDCARYGGKVVLTSVGYNLVQAAGDVVGPNDCSFTAAGDIRGRDPRLSPLVGRGGQTPTHGLLYGSPAIDAGPAVDCPPYDQRGVARPLDGNGDGTAVCDIGAFETARVWGVFLPSVMR